MTKPTYEELERQLTEANALADDAINAGKGTLTILSTVINERDQLRQRLEQAEQRILESQRKGPVAWMSFHKDTAMFTNSEYTANVRWCRRRVYPLVYAASVEEAISAEAEKWKRILRESCDESRSELMYEQGFICSGAEKRVEEAVKAERESFIEIRNRWKSGVIGSNEAMLELDAAIRERGEK